MTSFATAICPPFLVAGLLVAITCADSMGQAVGAAAARPVANGTARQFDLRRTNFRGVRLDRVNFAGRDLSGSYLQDTDLSGAIFWRTRLDAVDLRGARNFTIQQLASASWDPARPPRLDAELNRFRRFWERRRADGMKLDSVNLWGARLGSFNFADADLRRAIFIGAVLKDAVLLRADLEGVVFAGADLSGADLRGARGLTAGQLVSAHWEPRHPPRVDDALNLLLKMFERRKLVGQDLRGVRWFGGDLAGADLTSCKLEGAALIGVDLRRAVLREADLTDAVLTGADISGADLRGVKGLGIAGLLGARWQPSQPPALDGALNLARARFQRRSMAGMDLSGANLWGADLRGANFEGARLAAVVLVDARLRGATLVEADLTDAILTGADLSAADLRNATGLTAGQLLSAHWAADAPPKLSRDLELIRKLWYRRDLQGYALRGACLWDSGLRGARLHGGEIEDVLFVRTDLRGATFSRASLRNTLFLGADISGADFRGARNLALKSILSAVWEPRQPPVMDAAMGFARQLLESRRIEFDMVGASLHQADPKELMGPARVSDRVARFSLQRPPHLGLGRLIELLRKGDHAQLQLAR